MELGPKTALPLETNLRPTEARGLTLKDTALQGVSSQSLGEIKPRYSDDSHSGSMNDFLYKLGMDQKTSKIPPALKFHGGSVALRKADAHTQVTEYFVQHRELHSWETVPSRASEPLASQTPSAESMKCKTTLRARVHGPLHLLSLSQSP